MSPFFIIIILSLLSLSSSTSFDSKSTYIVHTKYQNKPDIYSTHHEWYTATLSSLSTTDSDSNPLLYTYTTAYSGFAASLTSQETDEILKSDSVIGIYQDTPYQLHTTHTPEFLGLQTRSGLPKGLFDETLNKRLHDIIIGVLDTRVWPESKSFDDTPHSTMPQSKKRVVHYTRTLTNVGDANSVYSVVVDGPSTVSISVKPSKLVFGKVLENKRYTVTFKSKKRVAVKDAFGSITWTNSQHQVRSPVAFTWSR
ncbi:hypothetical protein Lal_00026293 [Lupinus albus]|nr:hypothetical protein Lal_00026293 [Lupinus albus]